jgi:hypothetical protein
MNNQPKNVYSIAQNVTVFTILKNGSSICQCYSKNIANDICFALKDYDQKKINNNPSSGFLSLKILLLFVGVLFVWVISGLIITIFNKPFIGG